MYTLVISTVLFATAFASDAPSLNELSKEQLEDLKQALHEMNLDKVFDDNQAQDVCNQKKQAALDAVNRAKDTVSAWPTRTAISASAAANAAPGEIAGPAIGAGADMGILKLFADHAQSDYDSELDFNNMVDFGQFFNTIQDRLRGEEPESERIDHELHHHLLEFVAKGFEFAAHRFSHSLQHRMYTRFLTKTLGAAAFMSAEQHAENELFQDAFETEAEQKAAQAAEEALIEKFGGMVTAEGARMLEREAAKRAAEEAVSWIPILGQGVSAGIGAMMMSESCEEVNNDFHGEYTDGVEVFFELALAQMKQNKQTFIDHVTQQIDDAIAKITNAVTQ